MFVKLTSVATVLLVSFFLSHPNTASAENQGTVEHDIFDFSSQCRKVAFYRFSLVSAIEHDSRQRFDPKEVNTFCDWNRSGDRMFLYASQIVEASHASTNGLEAKDDRVVFSYGLLIASDQYQESLTGLEGKIALNLIYEAAMRGNIWALNEYLNRSIGVGRVFSVPKTKRALDSIVDLESHSCFGLFFAYSRVFYAPPYVESDEETMFVGLKDQMIHILNQDCRETVDFLGAVYDENYPHWRLLLERR